MEGMVFPFVGQVDRKADGDKKESKPESVRSDRIEELKVGATLGSSGECLTPPVW